MSSSALLLLWTRFHTFSNRVSEIWVSINDQLALIRQLVPFAEIDCQQTRHYHHKSTANHGRNDTRNVIRPILAPENQTASDAANTAEAGKRRTAERSLPLTTDVVCLICHTSRNVGVDTSDSNKDTEIFDPTVVCEGHDGQTNQRDCRVADQNDSTDTVAVTDPGGGEHHDRRKGVRWCDETLRRRDTVPKIISQDNGKEEGERIAHCRQATSVNVSPASCCVRAALDHLQENESKSPDLKVPSWLEEFRKREGFWIHVATIFVESTHDIFDLGRLEERPGRPAQLLIGKSYDEGVCKHCNATRDDTLHDENPVHVSIAV